MKELRIAICDDDRDEIAKIQHVIAEIQGNYQVDTYSTGKTMLEAAGQGEKYDIAFCDIYMKNENGMNTAMPRKCRPCHLTPLSCLLHQVLSMQ